MHHFSIIIHDPLVIELYQTNLKGTPFDNLGKGVLGILSHYEEKIVWKLIFFYQQMEFNFFKVLVSNQMVCLYLNPCILLSCLWVSCISVTSHYFC